MLPLLVQEPLVFLFVFFIVVCSLSIHEFAHALAATKLGDDTAQYLGRLSLNPLVHLDPLGTLLLVLFGFGWGKPVPFNPFNLENPQRDSSIIAFAGPLSNILIAFVASMLVRFVPMPALLMGVFSWVIYYNVLLASFNLIPVHPLDGFKVIGGFLPSSLYYQWMSLMHYGPIILMFLVVTNLTHILITPIASTIMSLIGFSL